MKKLIVFAVAACLAFTVAIPAMAVDVDFSGYYRVRGFMNSNVALSDDNSEAEAYYDNRFRLQTVFTANDNVSVTTRFDALDGERWGAQNTPVQEEYIDWDRIYMDIKTDYGYFKIGHQQAGVWGLDVFDNDYNDDRIKYMGKAGDVIFGGIIQKTLETDSLDRFEADGQADADKDVYYLFGIYKKDNIEAGLLGAYSRDASAPTHTITAQALLPYWDLTFGPVGVKGEIVYEMGEVDYNNVLMQDQDIDALSYNLEGSFNLDMAKLYAGWVSVSGQDSSNDITSGNKSNGGVGNDYNPFAILTDDLGGKILNSGDGFVSQSGVDMWYLGADATVNDKLTVNAILGQAMANEDDWAKDIYGIDDDEYGMELDIGATYQIMDNLQYSATLAYLMTGDMLAANFGATDKNDVEDNFGFMHELKVSF